MEILMLYIYFTTIKKINSMKARVLISENPSQPPTLSSQSESVLDVVMLSE